MSDVIVPYNRDAEEALLGSILINPECLVSIAGMLAGQDFYIQRHRYVWEALLHLQERSMPIDFLTLTEEVQRQGQLEDVGGPAYLAGLINSTPTSLNAEAYAAIIVEAAGRRRLLNAANEIARLAFQQALPFENVLDGAEKAVFAISQQHLGNRLCSIEQVVGDVFDQISAASAQGGEMLGVPTGFVDLDCLLNGLQGGDLLLVAARPGQGKTGFLLSLVCSVAQHCRKHIAVFSLEMSSEQLVQRLLAQVSGIDSQRLRAGRIYEQEWPRLVDAVETLSLLPVFLDDTPALTPAQMRSACRKLQIEHGLDLVVVDYLQLMHSGQKVENRVLEVGYISRSLKALARELNVPVVAAAQLSRAVEQRADKKPTLSDLRESGSLEMDSDVVIFLYRPEVYDPGDPLLKGRAEISIAKHRNGPVGQIELLFRAELARFENAAVYKRELNGV